MKNKIDNLINGVSNSQYNLIGLSILRIMIGFHLLWQLFLIYPIKDTLWDSIFLNPNVEFLHNDIYNNIFYFLGLLIVIIFTCGYGNLFFKILTYIYVVILYSAGPFLGDGGSNILMIVLAYLIFTNNSSHFTLFGKKESNNQFFNVSHNLFLLLTLIQICVLYFFAGFSKAQGEMWLNGTALYYILQIDAFTMEPTKFLIEYILNSPMLLTVGAYTAIFMQLFFPLIVFNKYFRYIVLIGSMGFHLSIAFLMGLVQFGFIMIALDLVFLTDKEYRSIKNYFYRKLIFIKKILYQKLNSKENI